MILYGVYIYSIDPLVVSVSDNFVPQLMAVMPDALKKKAYFFVFPTWTKEPWSKVISTSWLLRSLPKSRTTFMCSTFKEEANLKRVGFRTRFCHQNLFCNEDDLVHVDVATRPFDAIYNAVLQPYKRHDLLRDVRNLRLITGSLSKVEDLKSMGLGHATVNERYLTKREISDVLSQCKCGLALSMEEGGMLASTEYLLCGLPVVSTRSIGGRDVYYNNANHIICNDDVNSVACAVNAAAKKDWDRAEIRRQAIDRTKEFRFELEDCVRKITGTSPFDSASVAGSWFAANFLTIHFMREFFDGFDGAGSARLDLLGKFT